MLVSYHAQPAVTLIAIVPISNVLYYTLYYTLLYVTICTVHFYPEGLHIKGIDAWYIGYK